MAVQIANRMPHVHDFQVCPQTIRRMPDSRCKPLFWLPINYKSKFSPQTVQL
jgi:hypothetical protein